MHFLISSLWNIWRYKIKRANLVLCSNGLIGIKVCNLYCRYCIDCFLTQSYRHGWHNYNSSDEPVWIWDPLQWPFFFLNPNLFLMPFDCRDENSCTTQCFPKKNVNILWDSFLSVLCLHLSPFLYIQGSPCMFLSFIFTPKTIPLALVLFITKTLKYLLKWPP